MTEIEAVRWFTILVLGICAISLDYFVNLRKKK